jgi:hypothetical protein
MDHRLSLFVATPVCPISPADCLREDYSTLAVTEALGSSNKAQVADLGSNNGNQFTPAYGIFEDGQPTRIVLINVCFTIFIRHSRLTYGIISVISI